MGMHSVWLQRLAPNVKCSASGARRAELERASALAREREARASRTMGT